MPLYVLSDVAEREIVPFRQALQPLVAAALSHVDFTAFHAPARESLSEQLLGRLSFACAPTLQRAFERFEAPGASLLSLLISTEVAQPADFRYRAFVQWLLGDGWRQIHTRYPVLNDVMAGLCSDWASFCSEFAARLRTDFPEAVVERLVTGESDPHHGGRQVVLIGFADGSAAVYKPRDVGMEHALSVFLRWCNENLGLRDLGWYAPWVRCRAGYGWMERVEAAPCNDEGELRHFYRSAGGLTALLYLLGATDCHSENVIAHGRYPVLIDAETLLQPRYMPPLATANVYDLTDPRGWDTVARPGYLPRWEATDASRAADASGLNGSSEGIAARGPVWLQANTDAMRLTEGELPPRPTANRARLGVETTSAADWQVEVEAGFAETWHALAQGKESLPLQAFAALTTRFVYRPTQLYTDLLWQSAQPEHLVSAAEQERAFDLLERSLEVLHEPEAERRLAEAERAALRRRDVPLFSAACAAGTLDGVPLPFPNSPWDDVRERLRHWDGDAFSRQKAIVRGSLRALAARPVPYLEHPLPLPAFDGAAPHRALLLRSARALADELLEAGFLADGARGWIALVDGSPAQHFQLEPIGLDLYGGKSGVALFLAAAGKTFDDARYAAAARDALQPLLRVLASGSASLREALIRGVPGGGVCGFASVVYALAHVGSLLGDIRLLDAAQDAAALLTSDRIGEDRYHDITVGGAGTLCALLALWRIAPEPKLLDTATACGEHLLRHRTGAPGLRAWRNIARVPLTGLGHGAAGIAMALSRLFEATGDERMRAAAIEARAYERSLFDRTHGNWPDLRDNVMENGVPGFSMAWCHGAPGIGLSRLHGTADDAADCAWEIDAAIEATRRFGIRGPDYLCCGTMGRIEVLLEAGTRTARRSLVEDASAASALLCERAEANGGFRLLANASADGCKPGFFRGSAGIGYGLLRCADPGTLPCILALE